MSSDLTHLLPVSHVYLKIYHHKVNNIQHETLQKFDPTLAFLSKPPDVSDRTFTGPGWCFPSGTVWKQEVMEAFLRPGPSGLNHSGRTCRGQRGT